LVTLWKPRTIFEGLSLINTLLGIVFGIYGFVYVYHRHVRPFEPSTLQWLTYAFVFHRFLLIGGDLFPSLDRCVAILFPLKYYMVSSPCCAFALYLVWTCIAITLTLIAWTLQIVPLENGTSAAYAPFFMLTNFKFVAMISIPYLFMLGIAVTCDVIALTIAVMRKKKLMTPKTSKQNTNSLNFSTGNSQDMEKKYFLNVFKGQQSIDEGSPTKNMNLDELKLTIRCLSLTMWYFLSQLCVVLPGVIFFGCDLKSEDPNDLLTNCGTILNVEVRMLVFFFYQFQFLKPFFYIAFDRELREGLCKLCACYTIQD